MCVCVCVGGWVFHTTHACQITGVLVLCSDGDAQVQLYAKDEARFFQDFAAAFTKLQELGVPAFHSA